MNIFIVCHTSDPQKVGSLIRDHFSGDFYDLGSGQWLLSATMTAQAISEALLLGPGNHGVVLSMANYWGHAEPNLWEWIKTKAETVRAG